MKTIPKTRPDNVTPFVLDGCWRSMALINGRCDSLARQRSENVWGSPMSSTKLSSHSSRNAKLRPNSKRNHQISHIAQNVLIDGSLIQVQEMSQLFIRVHNETLSSPRCAAAIQIVRPAKPEWCEIRQTVCSSAVKARSSAAQLKALGSWSHLVPAAKLFRRRGDPRLR